MTEIASQFVEAARTLVAEALDRPVASIPGDGDIQSIRAWDSLGHVRILMAIEAKLGAPLDTETISTLRSIMGVARAMAINPDGAEAADADGSV